MKINKDDYIKIVNEKLNGNSKEIMLKQIDSYYKSIDNFNLEKHKYKKGDLVFLKKGTLLHGTYKNIEGLKEIATNGLISSWFIDGRLSKYPSSVGVWNLKEDYYLKDYINFYSGGTILFGGVYKNGINTKENKTKVIPYDEMPNILNITTSIDSHMWVLEQTKEARFMPSLVQNRVQIGIIFNGDNEYIKNLLKGDILNNNVINDEDVKDFVNQNYYDKFIIDRKNKDDFFTDRESAVLFGIPACFIEGVLVGRLYENDKEKLNEIKRILPNAYICNLEGEVIYE